MSKAENNIAKFLNLKATPSNRIELFDKNNNEIYYENSNGFWMKKLYDSNNNEIYFENSDGFWIKREYDSNDNEIFLERSDGYWRKIEYDSNNNEIYYETSNGLIRDNRPKKEYTVAEIEKLIGKKNIKIIK